MVKTVKISEATHKNLSENKKYLPNEQRQEYFDETISRLINYYVSGTAQLIDSSNH